MARGPRSRASRAERRMQKERAASALAHGLPVPTPLPTRIRSGEARSSRPAAHLLTPVPRSGLPLGVKLFGLVLGLLGLLYGLTLFRDRVSSVEASLPSAAPNPVKPLSPGARTNAASLAPEPAASAPLK